MRLDKFLCESLGVTRREATILLRRGEVFVDQVIEKRAATKITEAMQVEWQSRILPMPGPRYFMLNKPDGFVCSHEDSHNPSALILLDEVKLEKLHFAGRLDVDTTGLVLITDDGQWSHRITSPKHACEKVYRVWLEDAIEPHYQSEIERGISLRSEKNPTLPGKMQVVNPSENELLLTISEGKYHQVKRMFAALGNKVERLHRESIGQILLDEDLAPGEYRPLTDDEIANFI